SVVLKYGDKDGHSIYCSDHLCPNSSINEKIDPVADPGFQFLELFLSTLHGQALSLIKTMLQVLHCDLEVLLHPLQVGAGVLLLLQLLLIFVLIHDSHQIISAPDFCIQSALHGINDPLAVPLDLLHLFIFLSQLPVNFTLDLVELQMDT
uniref:Uncharacterized protein n=1 Tax=Paramormyrops kingsleyae TaxID=1676925 RepID=A0A3B3R5F1_9TELE